MSNDLINLVRSFNGKRVLLIGDLILDRYVTGDAERISPEAPVPVLRGRSKRARPSAVRRTWRPVLRRLVAV